MPDTQGGSPTPAGGQPAGTPAPASGVDLKAVIAEALASFEPRVAAMVTGATKRQTAEAIEALKVELNTGGKPADDPSKVSPEKVKNAELNDRLKKIEAESARYKARAIRGAVSEAVSTAKVTASARALLIDSLCAQAKEAEDGSLHIPEGDSQRPLAEYLAAYLKGKDDLLESAARSGSGAASGSGWTGAMPTSKGEVLYTFGKDSKGRTTRTARPGGLDAFIAAHGRAAFDALPV